jgi:predicted O-linked N-acetylglucosamine transferase (SPINDLY family)
VRPPDLQQTYALAIEHHQAGRLREAEDEYRRILLQKPDHADAMQMLGVLLGDLGSAAAGEELIRRAIAINPHAPQYYGNLGMILAREGRTNEAIAAYRGALAIYPQYPEAENNLALALLQQGHMDEALAHVRRSVALRPQYEEAYIGLGNALLETGRLQEAVASYRRAIALSACSQAWHNLLFALHFDVSFDSKRLLEEHRRWAQLCADRFAPPRDGPGAVDSSTRRLRVGYVSPDLREHPVGWFLAPLLENRNQEQFESFCYADVPNADATTARLKAASDVWRDTIRMTDEQLAGQIRADRIDILIDLAMHTGRRLPVFARNPAPVQASYLAYCSTTGLKTIDFRLTDPYLDTPQTAAEAYSEQSIFLPRTYWCYQPLALAPLVEPAPIRKNQVVTFGCLNSYRKVTDATLSLWSRLLTEVKPSHLLIHSPQGSHRRRVTDFFAAAGVDPARIRFVEPQAARQYLATYHQIDVALDPLPYGGGTTTCDALWMGVPVVSLRGRTAVGRAGASILSNVGLSDLVADTPEQYIRIAAALAADPSRLMEVRGTLRARLQTSSLMDAPQFARDFEAALHAMWRERGKQ